MSFELRSQDNRISVLSSPTLISLEARNNPSPPPGFEDSDEAIPSHFHSKIMCNTLPNAEYLAIYSDMKSKRIDRWTWWDTDNRQQHRVEIKETPLVLPRLSAYACLVVIINSIVIFPKESTSLMLLATPHQHTVRWTENCNNHMGEGTQMWTG